MSTSLAGNPVSPDSGAFDSIVDDLEQRGWSIVPGFLPPDEAVALASESHSLWDSGAFRPAGVGVGAGLRIREDIRRDHVLWLEDGTRTALQQAYWDRLEALRMVINRRLFLGLFDFEAHFAVYPEGAFYRRHLDRHRGIEARVVTCILYLNEGWTDADGGLLRLYLERERGGSGEGETLDVPPRLGTLACFFSGDFWHEVLPARRERMSITGWFRTRQ